MLTPEQRASIREFAARGTAKAEIARRLKVSRDSVYRVLKGAQGGQQQEAAAPLQASGRTRGLLVHLYAVFEDLRALKDFSWGMLPGMAVVDRIHNELSPEENAPGFEEWKQICLRIAVGLKRIQRLVNELRLDTPIFQRLYLEMLDVRTQWMRFGISNEPVEEEEKEVTVNQEYLPVLDRVIGNLKKLIIGNGPRV